MFMNKKVLTLCAGLLLAGSVYAADYDSFIKVGTKGTTVAASVNGHDSYQLAVGNKLLAMQRDATTGEMSLQLVAARNADLMETLWTVSMMDDSEGGVSYIFYNKAYGMPLAFDSNDAKYNGVNATIATGNVNEWKWRSGAAVSNPVQMYSNFHPDSALVLVNDGSDNIVAKKVYTKNTAASNFGGVKIQAYEANPVVLGTDALNSMLGIQDPTKESSRMQLGFTRDQLNGVENLWLKDYRAVAAIAPYNDPLAQVAQNALAAAKNATTPQAIIDAIFASVPSDGSYTEAQIAVVDAMAKAAQDAAAKKKATVTSVKDAVEEEFEAYGSDLAIAKWVADYAEMLAAAIDGDVKDKEGYDAALDAVVKNFSQTSKEKEAAKAATLKAFKDLMSDAEGATVPAKSILNNLANEYVAQAEAAAADQETARVTVMAARTAAKNAEKVDAITAALDEVTTYGSDQEDVITALKSAISGQSSVEDAIAALEKAIEESYPAADNSEYVSLLSVKNNDVTKNTYLRLDTTYLENTGDERYLAFAVGTYTNDLTGEDDAAVDPAVQNDFNGRYNFKFTYYPTQDSLLIEPQSYIYPYQDKAYTALTASDVSDLQADLDLSTYTEGKDHNGGNHQFVKLEILATDHREVSIGRFTKSNTSDDEKYTINTRIYLNGDHGYTRTTLADGVYHFQLTSDWANRADDNGKYEVVTYDGDDLVWEAPETTQRFGVAQDFNHIPRTQWVVEQNEGVPGEETVNITNREFPNWRYPNVQLYKDADGNVFARYAFSVGDTLAVSKIDAKYTTDPYLGYKHLDNAGAYEKFYALDYLSGIELGNYVNASADSAVYVDLNGGQSYIEFVKASEDTEYGYASKAANAVQLKRQAYMLRMSNTALLTSSDLYICDDSDTKSFVASADASRYRAKFMLKENNQLISENGDTTCYYALQSVPLEYDENNKAYIHSNPYSYERVGVRDASMTFSMEDFYSYSEEVRVATFAVVEDTTPLYRRLGETLPEDGFEDMTVQNAKIYTINSAEKEYLYEDANSKYSENLGINFLGVESKGVNAKAAMFVDTAYVRNNTPMPQYMLVMNPQIVEADTIWCNATSTHKHATLADSLACPHTTVIPYSVTGRYLINAQDSVNAGDDNYIWNRDYTRLAFVEAKHIGDTLVIFRNGEPSTAKADSIYLGDNKHKNVAFSFRLVNTDACDFLIETVGDKIIPTDGKGGWVAVKNGVPVVAKYDSYNDAINDAEIFNIESTEETATANESIVAGEVSVVAADGAVIVKGAEGKNVVVSTILGKVVANEVLNSDNETIAAPAGIVVVSVDGESFKVAVK